MNFMPCKVQCVHTTHKHTKCECLKQLHFMLLLVTYYASDSSYFHIRSSVHMTALYITAIMKSCVSQLVKMHGEMWRTAALLLIGFYNSYQHRHLNRVRISFREKKWIDSSPAFFQTNSVQIMLEFPLLLLSAHCLCLPPVFFRNLSSKERGTEGRIVFLWWVQSLCCWSEEESRRGTGWWPCYESSPHKLCSLKQ